MEAKYFFEVWPIIYLFDLFRYLIPASLFFLGFWVIGKGGLMHLFIRRTMPPSRQLRREFAYSMSTVLIFSLVGFGIHLAERAELTKIYYDVDDYGIAYMFISLIISILFHDFYFYWTHRMMHHKSVFRYVHHVHHESANPSPWAAYSFHPWEALIQAMVMPALVFTIPLHPFTVFIFLAYMIIRNVIGHLGFEILPKGFTKNKWMNWNTAVTHHSMHHEHFHGNYGLYFTWWDKLMKTEHADYHNTFEEVKSRPKVCELKPGAKKSTSVFILVLLTSSGLSSQSVEGDWTTYNEQNGAPLSIVQIARSGNTLQGTIKEIFADPSQGEDPVCTKCTGELRDKKVIGMKFLWGFRQDGTQWLSGKILDPQSGEVYSGKLWLENDNTLHVRGFAGPLDLFYRTQTWKREGSAKDKTPAGTWKTIDDHWKKVKSIVEIININGELRGFIRKIFLLPHEGTDPVCTECSGELKNAKVVGMKIIWDFKLVGDKWTDGKILDPGTGNVYDASIALIDANTLKVRGYLGPFYRSQVWKRAR